MSQRAQRYEDRRRSPRHKTDRIVVLVSDKRVSDGITTDISLQGFGGEIEDQIQIGDEVHVYFNNDLAYPGGRRARVVRQIETGGLGFEFIDVELNEKPKDKSKEKSKEKPKKG
ncbi:MAG: PilZ domain-containing protein [Planctomycetota bacterium]